MNQNSSSSPGRPHNFLPLLVLGLILGVPFGASASPVTPGQLDTASTTQSIGIEWAVSGDTDHDATCSVEYRVLGDAMWRSAMPLVRVDSNNGNTLAGSILFLDPGTVYEVRLALSDPDGGADTRTVNVPTAAVPAARSAIKFRPLSLS